MKNGPILHLVVEQDRIGEAVSVAQRHVREDIDHARLEIDRRIEVAVANAYRAGLRDGFAQGCIAEATAAADA